MKQKVGVACALLALSSAARAADAPIRIEHDSQGGYFARPAYLYGLPDRFKIESDIKWSCGILPPGVEPDSLIIRAPKDPAPGAPEPCQGQAPARGPVRLVLASGLHRVVIPVLVEPASQDWLSYGTLATLLFALGLSVAVGRRRNENAIALEAAAAGLKTEASLLAGAIGRLSKMTSARPVDTIPQPSPSLSRSPSLAAPPDAPSRRVSPLAGSAGALFKAVRDWRTLNAFGSPEVERALQELQDLREEIAGGLNETDAKARLERCGTVLAQLTLAITDEQSDPQRPNHMLEEAMMAILQAAGLKPLSPRDGDPYDPKQHHMMGPGIESGPNKRRNSVARVARRGLIRGANTIQLAEVQLYN